MAIKTFEELAEFLLENIINATKVPAVVLAEYLQDMNDSVEFNVDGFTESFLGKATTTTNPGTPATKVWYLANGPGTYTNFGPKVVSEEFAMLIWNGATWDLIEQDIATQDLSIYAKKTMDADLNANSHNITNVPDTPAAAGNAINKNFIINSLKKPVLIQYTGTTRINFNFTTGYIIFPSSFYITKNNSVYEFISLAQLAMQSGGIGILYYNSTSNTIGTCAYNDTVVNATDIFVLAIYIKDYDVTTTGWKYQINGASPFVTSLEFVDYSKKPVEIVYTNTLDIINFNFATQFIEFPAGMYVLRGNSYTDFAGLADLAMYTAGIALLYFRRDNNTIGTCAYSNTIVNDVNYYVLAVYWYGVQTATTTGWQYSVNGSKFGILNAQYFDHRKVIVEYLTPTGLINFNFTTLTLEFVTCRIWYNGTYVSISAANNLAIPDSAMYFLVFRISTQVLSFVAYNALSASNDYVVLATCLASTYKRVTTTGWAFSVDGMPFNYTYQYHYDLVFSEALDRLLFPSNIYLFTGDTLPIYKSKLVSQNNLLHSCKLAVWWEDANNNPTYEFFDENYLLDATILSAISTIKIALKQYVNKTKFYYKNATVNIKDPSGVSGTKNFLMIGDSLTNLGTAPYTKAILVAKLTSATPVSIGTINDSIDAGIKCEGRGGWSYKHLVGKTTKYGTTEIVPSYAVPSDAYKNPFLFKCFTGNGGGGVKNADLDGRYLTDIHPTWCFQHTAGGITGHELDFTSADTTKDYYVFDFKKYITACSLANPDVITIAFGQNDLTENIPLMMAIVIGQIRYWSGTVKIGIAPLHGYSQISSATIWELSAAQWIEALMKYVEQTAGDSNLKIVPTWCHVNYDFGWLLTSEAYIDSLSTAKAVTVSDGVHPTTRGLREIARAYAAFIANCL